VVGSPDFPDVALLEKDEARGVHVGELVAAQEIEFAGHCPMMSGLETEKLFKRNHGLPRLSEGEANAG
jgi:hypothetical protein